MNWLDSSGKIQSLGNDANERQAAGSDNSFCNSTCIRKSYFLCSRHPNTLSLMYRNAYLTYCILPTLCDALGGVSGSKLKVYQIKSVDWAW